MGSDQDEVAAEIDLWPARKRGDREKDPEPGRDLDPGEVAALLRSLPKHFRPDVADWLRRAVESFTRPGPR